MNKVTFKDDNPLGTGGEFRLRRSRAFLGGTHVGNIYARPPMGLKGANSDTPAATFFYAPLGKFNQPHFHGGQYATLEGCKLSL